MASRKRSTAAEVLKQLDLSHDNDSDRKSDNQLDDVESLSSHVWCRPS
jgi:hypothetical protein